MISQSLKTNQKKRVYMKSIKAVFCECCRRVFPDEPSNNTKNDMCIECNQKHNKPESEWVVTLYDYLGSLKKQ